MSGLLKWKKALPAALAAGIISLSAYGIFHTASAYSDIKQSQAIDNISGVPASSTGDGLLPGGNVCNPLGCAACGGCTNLLYQENSGTLPDFDVLAEVIG